MLTILLDENITGYAEYLSRFIFSPAWSDISAQLGVRITTIEQVGLAKGTPDKQVWEICQQEHFYLLTDNRNKDNPDSLEGCSRFRTSIVSVRIVNM